jgi:putative tricarboxylic transport membrane protein
LFGPKEMSDAAFDYWSEKLEEMTKTDEWKAELEKNGWESEFRNSKDFTSYLEDQDKVIVELLTALGMEK